MHKFGKNVYLYRGKRYKNVYRGKRYAQIW